MKWLGRCFAVLLSVVLVCGAGAQTSTAPTNTPVVQTVRLEAAGPIKLDTGSAPFWSYLVPVAGPIISGLLAFLGVWFGLGIAERNTIKTIEATRLNNDASIWQKANETELRDIQAKLDGFYIPFELLTKANQLFAQDMRAREDKDYRLLLKLFDQKWRQNLSTGDQKAIDIICNNAEELRALIASKSGLVDGKILEYLSRATAHFRILYLAYKSELGTDPTRFAVYVYPRELTFVLRLEIDRLRHRMDELRANPARQLPPLRPLEIPPEHQLKEWVDPDGRLSGMPSPR